MKIWLCDLTHTQQIINSDVMPAAIGGIAAFTEKQFPELPPIRLFKYPKSLVKALDQEWPDVIGFSNYVWNSRLSYKFAEWIKKHNPATFIVFGGPHFPLGPDEQIVWLKERLAIDSYIVHEGEISFVYLVADLQRGYRSKRIFKEKSRLTDLTVIPSPYTTGKLDEFFDGKLIPILQTTRGCPFQCTFCVEGEPYYTKVYRSSSEKIRQEVEYIGKKIQEVGGRLDCYISDSNFGMYKPDLETCRALAESMEKYNWPEYINTTTGKNQKARVLEAAKLVKGALRLSGSVQSLDKEVLSNVKRSNIAEEEILDLALQAAEIGANSYSEIILGLPGDSSAKHMKSLRTIVDARFQNVYTWQLMLLPGSELDTAESRKQFGMETRFRVLPRCFGQFQVRGETIAAAEVEEICIALPTLSFQEYLMCRQFHLVIALCYNDGLFGPLLKLLRTREVSVFDWLQYLASLLPYQPSLVAFFKIYKADLQRELWTSKGVLEKAAESEIANYVNGQLGNNLLFTYRAWALMDHMEAIGHAAAIAARHLLSEGYEELIDDLVRYSLCRVQDLFVEREDDVTATFTYDYETFERLPEPITRAFTLSWEQQERIQRYLDLYGHTRLGVARMLMKLKVQDLYRSKKSE